MKTFEILNDDYTTGFRVTLTLWPDRPIEQQLRRERLYINPNNDYIRQADSHTLRQIILRNSSFRVDFGWSFESATRFRRMMAECIDQIAPKYSSIPANMISNGNCSWLGFTPFNVFERAAYEDLNTHELIAFNNDLIGFQTAVISFIANHKSYKAHSLLRNDTYRFEYYKAIRHNPIALEDAFHYFIESVKDTTEHDVVPLEYLEECIGCHYLHHPEIFFELLNFYILKGSIYGK